MNLETKTLPEYSQYNSIQTFQGIRKSLVERIVSMGIFVSAVKAYNAA
jgi:hypothetical protein